MSNANYGSILLTTADKVSRTIMKKTGSQTGYKPSEWADEINLMGVLPTRTASGAVASFSDGADDVPCVSVVVNIVPYQEGTGDASPNNRRLIHGYSSLILTKATGDLSTNTINGYYIDASGNFQPNASYKIVVAPVLNGKKYRVFTDEGQIIAGFFTSEPTTSSTTYNNSRTITNPNVYEITSPIDGYIGFRCSSGYSSCAIWDISSNYNVSLGRTVYGGTLDLVSGLLTITYAETDMGSLEWNYDSVNGKFYTTISDIVDSSGYGRPSPFLCSCYKVINQAGQGSSVEDISIYLQYNVNKRVWCKDTNYTTSGDFTNSVTGQKIVYELATPIEVQLTPQEVRTFLGVNNFYNDCGGNTEVEYRADTNLLISELGG